MQAMWFRKGFWSLAVGFDYLRDPRIPFHAWPRLLAFIERRME
jgi:hypothetical protein